MKAQHERMEKFEEAMVFLAKRCSMGIKPTQGNKRAG